MANKNGAWGIEIGSNAIKAIRLVKAKDGTINVADYEVLPFKRVLTTPDLNVEEAIRVNLDKLLTKHRVGKSTVVVSVPGSTAFAKFAKLPPVDPKRIPDIVKFEAVQQIPFPIDQVEWDYQVFASDDSPDVGVGIFAITKERLAQFLSTYRVANIHLDALTLSPLAVYNAMVYDGEINDDTPGEIYMDIGTLSTDIIIVEHGQIWLRTLPIGGNHFTEALVRAFKLSFPKAEKLKREAGTSKYARQIFQAMRPVFSDLVQEIQRSLGYYQSMNRDSDIEKLVGIGSTFRLPGMIKFLKQQLQIDVVRPDSFKRLSVDGSDAADFADHSLNLATAYGLALQGLEAESLNANLLPRHMLKQRLWRAKQPWIGAAAAVVAVAVGAGFVKLQHDKNVYENSFEKTNPKIQQVIQKAERLRSEYNQIATQDPRVRIENLRRILDYRDVWPKLLHDMSLASASLAPQEELLSTDYDQHTQIPRTERRRIYIDTMSATYSIGPLEGSAGNNSGVNNSMMGTMGAMGPMGPMGGGGGFARPSQTGKQNLSYEQMFGERRFSPAGPSEQNNSPFGAPARVPANTTPPQFTIRIQGTTPLREGARDLSRTFIKWLQDNAKRKNRPYEIVAGPASLVRIEPMSAVVASNRSTGGRNTAGPRLNNGAGANAVTSRFGNRFDTSGRGDATGSRGGSNQRSVAMTDLIPERPGNQERNAEDWSFEIEWEVQLLSPQDVRQTEEVRRETASGPVSPSPIGRIKTDPADPTEPATPAATTAPMAESAKKEDQA